MRREKKRRSTIRMHATDIVKYLSSEDGKLLDHLLDQARKTAIQAEKVIDDALAHIAESERRLASLEESNWQRMEMRIPRRQRRY